MLLEVCERKIDDIDGWDTIVDNSKGGTVFHKSWYLKVYGVNDILCGFVNGDLACAMPLYKNKDHAEQIVQSTKVVPYSGMFFAHEYLKGSSFHSKMKERKMIESMCEYLKTHYSDICFALNTEITDIVPFLRQGFYPEVRYTIMNDALIDDEARREKYERSRYRYLAIAKEKGIDIRCDLNLSQIAFKDLVFWSDDQKKDFRIYEQIINNAYAHDGGTAIGAYLEDRLIGIVILVWDKKRAYSILSYYDKQKASIGIGSVLYDAAISYTHGRLMRKEMDFEGSVLPGVESFFLSFGGRQSIYFNMHWKKDSCGEMLEGMYVYE